MVEVQVRVNLLDCRLRPGDQEGIPARPQPSRAQPAAPLLESDQEEGFVLTHRQLEELSRNEDLRRWEQYNCVLCF